MSNLAYIRVSTNEQTVENQKLQMKDLNIDKFFIDEGISGTKRDRAGLNELIDYVRDVDTVYVVSLDRLSRNTTDLEEIQAKIKAKGATIIPLDILKKLGMTEIPSDSVSKFIFDIMIVLSNYFAENERTKLLERQKWGIERAKKEGKFAGGTIKYSKNANGRNLIVYKKTFDMLANNNSIKNIAETLNVSRNTVYSMISRINNEISELRKLNLSDNEISNRLSISEKYIKKVDSNDKNN